MIGVAYAFVAPDYNLKSYVMCFYEILVKPSILASEFDPHL